MPSVNGKLSSEVNLERGEDSVVAKNTSISTQTENGNEKSERSGSDGGSAQSSFVDWDGPGDLSNPLNWSKIRKLIAVLSICSLAFVSSFASSIFAPAAIPIAEEFHVSETVANLGVSLYVLGFAAGKSFCTRLYFHLLVLTCHNRSIALGSAFRSLWSQDPTMRRHVDIYSLPDPDRSSQECCNSSCASSHLWYGW